MSHLVLDDEQAQAVTNSRGDIQVRDRKGNILGYMSPDFTAADIAEAKRRLASDQPRHTTQQVLKHLRSLEPQ